MINIHNHDANKKLKSAFVQGRVDFTFDCDDVITPESSGNHAAIKKLIVAADSSGFFKIIFAGSPTKVEHNDHGHITNFPSLVYNAYRRGPNVLKKFVDAVYAGGTDSMAKHYDGLRPDAGTLRFFDEALEHGNRVGIYSSGPYQGHMEGVLRLTGLKKYFEYGRNIYDIASACFEVSQKRLIADHLSDMEIANLYFKPSDNGYDLAMHALWGKASSERVRVYIDDGVQNLQPAIKRGDIAIWVNPEPEKRILKTRQLAPQISIGELSDIASLFDQRASLRPDIKTVRANLG